MNKTYAFADVHGKYKLWEQIRDYCDETDTIYFLGDACDRGDDGLKIMKEILQDKRVIYLKGNHEEFFETIGAELVEGHFGSTPLWRQNGGMQTITDFCSLPEPSQLYYLKKIGALPIMARYINKKGQIVILSHAGFTPGLEPNKEYDFLWDRVHLYHPWPPEEKYKDVYIVHGHTPVPYVALEINSKVEIDEYEIWEPLVYADGHKIAIDVSSCTTGKVSLFDLDELKVAKNFYDKSTWAEVE